METSYTLVFVNEGLDSLCLWYKSMQCNQVKWINILKMNFNELVKLLMNFDGGLPHLLFLCVIYWSLAVLKLKVSMENLSTDCQLIFFPWINFYRFIYSKNCLKFWFLILRNNNSLMKIRIFSKLLIKFQV